MAIKDVEPKCFILALFIRSDGARFLLGSGAYEFKDDQQHFAANTMENDVVEVQGNDGYLLAGQVRRPGVQSFDGYVGDAGTGKAEVEEYRREFFSFFRKNFSYKVIYVFPDGSAIQRKRGFLVDAPVVQELYQIYPEYHVALNFEDINYYQYNEDADGNEIYGKSAVLGLTVAASGGLVWDSVGAVSAPYTWADPVEFSGSEVTVTNNLNVGAPIEEVQLKGDTYQQTYSGKNLFNFGQFYQNRASFTVNDGSIDITENSIQYAGHSSTSSQAYPAHEVSNKSIYGMTNLEPSTTYTISYKATTNTQCWVFFFNSSNVRTQVQQVFTSTEVSMTFTTPADMSWYTVRLDNRAAASNTISGIQIEQGSAATSYEPYVGGIPAPNPDYPQDIQVVTGEQTVKVTGKNLLDLSTFVKGRVDNGNIGYADGTSSIAYTQNSITFTTTAGYRGIASGLIPVRPNTQYFVGAAGPVSRYTDCYDSSGTWISRATSNPMLTPSNCHYVRISYQLGSAGTVTINYPQLEAGSTATDYEPYQSQSYTISLGSTELCKIGDYQDYIYKSGDDWYLHKEVGLNILSSDDNWYYDSARGGFSKPFSSDRRTGVYRGLCTHATVQPSAATWQGVGKCGWNTSNTFWIEDGGIVATSLADWGEWLANNLVKVYYVLATPTDTQITDTTLIGQLDALGAMKLFVGENNVLAAATGTNLPATLEGNYYSGIDYSGAGYVWEAGSDGGPKVLTIDSIDDVYPLLTITGPAINPTITNITAGVTFTYTGTVTNSQVLKVDMMNKTATLNGTSVIGNVSGDWLYFQPGDNRVEYTTENASAPDALIEWQEVVG